MLRLVDRIAREVDSPYFVARATARDIILVNVYGLRPGRATRDIDFGIAVESWNQFQLLKERLIATGKFVADRTALQRLIYSDEATGFSIPVDLVPFRGVASAVDTIARPPNRDTVLNVAGFEEALTSAVSMEMEEGFVVCVAWSGRCQHRLAFSLKSKPICREIGTTDRAIGEPDRSGADVRGGDIPRGTDRECILPRRFERPVTCAFFPQPLLGCAPKSETRRGVPCKDRS
jgi:hypothetical protein